MREWSRAVAPVPAHHHLSAARGRFCRAVEQQELGGNFVDKHVQENFGEEAALAARRDEPGPVILFRSTAASRREPTGELGAAALDRAASEARAAADDRRDMAVRTAGFVPPGWRNCSSDPLKSLTRHGTAIGAHCPLRLALTQS